MHLGKAEMEAILNLKVDALFAKWTSRLRLQDWDVTWRIVRRSELPPDKSGACDSTTMKKIAAIRILHPDDANPDWLDPYDIEYTVVHELVHLHLSAWALYFEDGDQAVILLEQAVHALASTLIAADRGERIWTNFPESRSVQDRVSMVR